MDRRGFVLGTVATLATSATAQQLTTSAFSTQTPEPPKEELDKAYAICRQRGHVGTAWGNGHVYGTNSVFISYPDRPASGYVARSETPWETCFYCKKQYRFVTTQEEQ